MPSLSNSYLYVSLSGDLKKPWRADVYRYKSNTSFHVGNFDTAEDAANEADMKALEFAGVEANLNFHIEEQSPELMQSIHARGPRFGNNVKN